MNAGELKRTHATHREAAPRDWRRALKSVKHSFVLLAVGSGLTRHPDETEPFMLRDYLAQ